VLTGKYTKTRSNDVEHGVSLLGLDQGSLFHTNGGHKSGILLDSDDEEGVMNSRGGKKKNQSAAKSGFISSGELSEDMSDFSSEAESDNFDTEKNAVAEEARRESLDKPGNKKLNFNEVNVENIRVRSASMFGQNYPKTSSIGRYFSEINAPFRAKFAPSDMRQLALVAHNHMKPAMKSFIESHSEVLKKFRITGTNTTMTMCKTIWGEENDDIEYGATCCSGPLGGDAQIASLICMEDIGGIIFFIDPLSAHPHQADIDSLTRLANVGNIILCPNPSTACGMVWMFRQALITGNAAMITSFFETLESPSVPEYKSNQKRALQAAINANGPPPGPPKVVPVVSGKRAKKKLVSAVALVTAEESDSEASEELSDGDEDGDIQAIELLGLETAHVDVNGGEDDQSDTEEKADKLVRRRISLQTNRKKMGGFREYMEGNLEKNRGKVAQYKSSFL